MRPHPDLLCCSPPRSKGPWAPLNPSGHCWVISAAQEQLISKLNPTCGPNSSLPRDNIFTSSRIRRGSVLCLQQCVIICYYTRASQVAGGKESTCQRRDTGHAGSVPGSGRSPGEGNGNLLQYSCLENPMDRGAWQIMGSQRVGHD